MSPQQSIAHYRIITKIGEGGMVDVYCTTDTKLNRDVAVKTHLTTIKAVPLNYNLCDNVIVS